MSYDFSDMLKAERVHNPYSINSATANMANIDLNKLVSIKESTALGGTLQQKVTRRVAHEIYGKPIDHINSNCLHSQ